jgi:hypothetical protein
MIDLREKVKFYDDRSKTLEPAVLVKVLFQNQKVCLCEVAMQDDYLLNKDTPTDVVLFDLENGRVLTYNYEFWFAEN